MTPKPTEDSILKQICQELRGTHALTEDQKQILTKVFEKRFPPALALVDGKKISSYKFRPSGRTVWVVKGRKGEYQVMPESMFCTCDDYYFRVMENKKQLCYHLVAQQLADALGRVDSSELADSRYDEVTPKWAVRASQR